MKRFLIIVICVMLVAFSLAAVLVAAGGGFHFERWDHLFDLGPASKYATDIDQTGEADLAGVTSVHIGTVSAPIHIYEAEGDTLSVHLKGTFSANREHAEPTLVVEEKGSSVVVEVKYQYLMGLSSNSELEMTVYLPATYADSLSLRTVSSYAESFMPLTLREFSFDTVSGDMNIAGVTAEQVDLSTTSGSVNIEVNGCDRLKFDSVSGDIEAVTDAAAVEASTTSGRIVLDGLSGSLDASSVSGEISAAFALLGEIKANNTSGGVSLTVPPHSSYTLDFGTVSGGFHSDTPVAMTDSSRTHIHGTVGEGGPTIRVQTVSGGLTIQ